MSRSKAVALARQPLFGPTAALAAAALGAAVLTALPQPAQAQVRGPQGSYQQSCRAAYMDGGVLRAECRTDNGGWRWSELEPRGCRGSDIFNFHGILACSGDPRNNRPDLNGPSYDRYDRYGDRRDRRDDRWDRREDRREDRWDRRDDRRERWDDRRGGGAATLYDDAGFGGRAFSLDRDMPDLRDTGMNDRVSSMRLRGTWEACSDAWFRGECRRFRGDVWNLRDQGFNDRISSLRRVR